MILQIGPILPPGSSVPNSACFSSNSAYSSSSSYATDSSNYYSSNVTPSVLSSIDYSYESNAQYGYGCKSNYPHEIATQTATVDSAGDSNPSAPPTAAKPTDNKPKKSLLAAFSTKKKEVYVGQIFIRK